MKRKTTQTIAFWALRGCALVVVAVLFILVYDIASKGIGAISWDFLTKAPAKRMTAGGIFPAIWGTILLSIGAVLAAFPLGVMTAIYLTEYAKPGKTLSVINTGITNLAGVPSIVFGLFGFALFVTILGFGASVLAGSLTLALMILPVIIKTSQEALLSVPQSFRSASLALGATKWQTIQGSVLPYAMPGVLTGTILGVSRAAGETAPILFTAAAYFLPRLPDSIFDQTMALPYHLYILSTQSINVRETQGLQYGTALVLLGLVLALNLSAILLRVYFRRKYRW
ncbi:MAG: phosphate ABC transporter permease PstA [Candidatus Micrarchaeota archaeon]